MEDSGQVVETLTVPGFHGPTAPKFTAPGGLTVQLPASSDFKTQVQKLSSLAGQGYMTDLMARKDVNWQPVKLAYDQWDYKQEGLTPAGAALVAVAVTWALGPGGAGIVGNTTTTAGLMADAAFASLASQATISLINNKGDLGKTLKELGSSQTVKATLAAALTAGVIEKLGATSTMQDLAKKTTFPEKLTYNLINATGRALANTAINGGDLEEALKQALIGGVVDTAHGEVASQIKGLESQYLAHKLAHALAGCVAGAAAQGTCRDGAIGAAVGEVVAQMFEGQKPGAGATLDDIKAYNSKVMGYSKLVAGAVSAYAGGNAQTAITTAEIAVQNNYLSKPQLISLQSELNTCKQNNCTESQINAVLDKYVKLSASNDAALAACTTTACVEQHRKVLSEAAAYSAETMWQVANSRGSEQLIGELQGRQNKGSTVQYVYGRAVILENTRKELDQFVLNQCQGLSQQACTTKLQNSQATARVITEILAGFTLAGIVVDIKDLLQAKTIGDYSLAVLGTVLPGLGDWLKVVSKGAKGVGEASEVVLPGMNRPVRPVNPNYPPNSLVVDAMSSPQMKILTANTGCVDCSEIAPKLLEAAGGKGQILEVRPYSPGALNVFENGKIEPDQFFHQVYTDGRYVYDPRLSSQPIPKGDWEQHIRSVNPGGVTISSNLKGLK